MRCRLHARRASPPPRFVGYKLTTEVTLALGRSYSLRMDIAGRSAYDVARAALQEAQRLRRNSYSRRSMAGGGASEAARTIGALLPSANPQDVVPGSVGGVSISTHAGVLEIRFWALGVSCDRL